MLRYLIATGLILSFAVPQLTTASCIQQTAEEQLAAAEIVVKATITNVQTGTTSTTVTADVDEVIKGDVNDTVTFVSGSGSGVVTSVDVYFEVGDQFELYLYRDPDGQLTTNTCSGTALVGATLYDDLESEVVTTATDNTTSYVIYLIAAITGLVGLGVGLAIGMHMRK